MVIVALPLPHAGQVNRNRRGPISKVALSLAHPAGPMHGATKIVRFRIEHNIPGFLSLRG